MVEHIIRKLFPAPFRQVEEKEQQLDALIGQRIAQTLARMDPFELIFKEFHGIFSDEFERPEEKLDTRSRLSLTMWAYQQSTDPSFKYLMDWVMNTQGNETLKRAAVTPERILYGRAQISGALLLVKEVKRLGAQYEDMLKKDQPFDEVIAVE